MEFENSGSPEIFKLKLNHGLLKNANAGCVNNQ